MDGNGKDQVPALEPCPWCSGEVTMVFHGAACPRVVAIEYHENGRVKHVELREMK